MEGSLIQGLLFVLLAALIGGILVRTLNLPPLLGYIIAGVIGGAIYPLSHQIEALAELGVILLLFSVGLELQLDDLFKFGNIAVIGAVAQVVIVTAILWVMLVILQLGAMPSFVLAFGFSLSSTALVIKILQDRGESDTVHGGIMISWLLVQDLAVIPMVILFSSMGKGSGASLGSILGSVLGAVVLLAVVYVLGRKVAPFLLQKLAEANSKELLLLGSVVLALGVAAIVSLFGINPAFGAFLAGLVISDTQENHAVFAETRPLRDLFVILFFVSLGFLVSPAVIISNFGLILVLSLLVLVIKTIVIFIICLLFGYRGRTAIANALGLAQIGEFCFLLIVITRGQNLITPELASIGMAVTLTTLVIAPILFKSITPLYRRLRSFVNIHPQWNFLFVNNVYIAKSEDAVGPQIIICGYGRVGRWVVKALKQTNVNFSVIDNNHSVVRDSNKSGVRAVFGDSSEPEVLEAAGVKDCNAVVIAFPDRIAQEDLISFLQTHYKDIKIIVRAHRDQDVKKLISLQVKKVIQPEFEGALAIVKQLLLDMGKSKLQVTLAMRALRYSHSVQHK